MSSSVVTPAGLDDFAKKVGLTLTDPNLARQKGGFYVIYGQGGVGKTTLAAQVAESQFARRGTLWLTMDANTASIAHLIETGVINELEISKWSQLEKVTNAYITDQPCDVVAIDNLSEGQSIDLRDITGGNRQPEIQEYGTSEAHMLSLVRKWRDIAAANDIIVFLIFWETTKQKGLSVKDELHVTSKLAEKLAGITGCVMHITSERDKDVTRKITIVGSSSATAAKFTRDRTDTVAWTIPNEIYYRLDQTPMVDIINTLRNGVPFPAAKYQRKVAPGEQ